MAKPYEVTDDNFESEVLKSDKPVLVDFWAPWCGPCKQLTPVIEKVVKSYGGKVRLVKINTDEHPGIAGQLRVQSIPTVYAFHDGRPVVRVDGIEPGGRIVVEAVTALAPHGFVGGTDVQHGPLLGGRQPEDLRDRFRQLSEPGFALQQRELGFLSFGEIADKRREKRRMLALDAGQRELDRKFRSVGPHGGDFHAPIDEGAAAGLQAVSHAEPVPFPEGRRNDQIIDPMSQHRVACISENEFRRWIELDDPFLGIDRDDAVEHGIQQRAQVSLVTGEQRRGALPATVSE